MAQNIGDLEVSLGLKNNISPELHKVVEEIFKLTQGGQQAQQAFEDVRTIIAKLKGTAKDVFQNANKKTVVVPFSGSDVNSALKNITNLSDKILTLNSIIERINGTKLGVDVSGLQKQAQEYADILSHLYIKQNGNVQAEPMSIQGFVKQKEAVANIIDLQDKATKQVKERTTEEEKLAKAQLRAQEKIEKEYRINSNYATRDVRMYNERIKRLQEYASQVKSVNPSFDTSKIDKAIQKYQEVVSLYHTILSYGGKTGEIPTQWLRNVNDVGNAAWRRAQDARIDASSQMFDEKQVAVMSQQLDTLYKSYGRIDEAISKLDASKAKFTDPSQIKQIDNQIAALERYRAELHRVELNNTLGSKNFFMSDWGGLLPSKRDITKLGLDTITKESDNLVKGLETNANAAAKAISVIDSELAKLQNAKGFAGLGLTSTANISSQIKDLQALKAEWQSVSKSTIGATSSKDLAALQQMHDATIATSKAVYDQAKASDEAAKRRQALADQAAKESENYDIARSHLEKYISKVSSLQSVLEQLKSNGRLSETLGDVQKQINELSTLKSLLESIKNDKSQATNRVAYASALDTYSTTMYSARLTKTAATSEDNRAIAKEKKDAADQVAANKQVQQALRDTMLLKDSYDRKIAEGTKLGIDTSKLEAVRNTIAQTRQQLETDLNAVKTNNSVWNIEALNKTLQGLKDRAAEGKIALRDLNQSIANAKLNGKYDSSISKLKNDLQTLYNLRSTLSKNISIGDKMGFDTTALQKQMSEVQKMIEEYRKLINSTPKGDVVSGASMSKAKIGLDEVRRGASQASSAMQQTVRTTDSLIQQFHRLSGASNSAASSFSQLKDMMYQFAPVYGLQQAVMSIIETGGEIEKQHIALQTIVGDLQNANDLFEGLKGLALQSPFTFGDLTKDVKQLAAYNVETDQLYDTTKRLADIASGLGVSFERIALAYGQVKSRSWLDAKELRQFSYAGVPLLQNLAQMYSEQQGQKVTSSQVKKMISNREVGFEDVQKVLWDMTDEGGKFYNMQLTLSETLLGRYNKLKDAWEIMLAGFAKGDSIIGGTFKKILDFITNILMNLNTVMPVLTSFMAVFAFNKLKGLGTMLVQKGQTEELRKQVMLKLRANFATENEYQLYLRQLLIEGKLTQQEAVRLGLINSQSIAIGRFGAIMNTVGNSAKAMWAAIGGWVGATIMAVTAVASRIYNMYDDAKEAGKQAAEETKQRYDNLRDFNESNDASLDKIIVKGVVIDEKALQQSIDEMKDKIQENVPELYGDYVSKLSDLPLKDQAEQLQQYLSDIEEAFSKKDEIEDAIYKAESNSTHFLTESLKKNMSDFVEMLRGTALGFEENEGLKPDEALGKAWSMNWIKGENDDVERQMDEYMEPIIRKVKSLPNNLRKPFAEALKQAAHEGMGEMEKEIFDFKFDKALGIDTLPSLFADVAKDAGGRLSDHLKQKLEERRPVSKSEEKDVDNAITQSLKMFENKYPWMAEQIQKILNDHTYYIDIRTQMQGNTRPDELVEYYKNKINYDELGHDLEKEIRTEERIVKLLSEGSVSKGISTSAQAINDYNKEIEARDRRKADTTKQKYDLQVETAAFHALGGTQADLDKNKKKGRKGEDVLLKRFQNYLRLLKEMNAEYEKGYQREGSSESKELIKARHQFDVLSGKQAKRDGLHVVDPEEEIRNAKDLIAATEKMFGPRSKMSEQRKKLIDDEYKHLYELEDKFQQLKLKEQADTEKKYYDLRLKYIDKFKTVSDKYGKDMASMLVAGGSSEYYGTQTKIGDNNGGNTLDELVVTGSKKKSGIEDRITYIRKKLQKYIDQNKDAAGYTVDSLRGDEMNDTKLYKAFGEWTGNVKDLLGQLTSAEEALQDEGLEKAQQILDMNKSTVAEIIRIDNDLAATIRKIKSNYSGEFQESLIDAATVDANFKKLQASANYMSAMKNSAFMSEADRNGLFAANKFKISSKDIQSASNVNFTNANGETINLGKIFEDFNEKLEEENKKLGNMNIFDALDAQFKAEHITIEEYIAKYKEYVKAQAAYNEGGFMGKTSESSAFLKGFMNGGLQGGMESVMSNNYSKMQASLYAASNYEEQAKAATNPEEKKELQDKAKQSRKEAKQYGEAAQENQKAVNSLRDFADAANLASKALSDISSITDSVGALVESNGGDSSEMTDASAIMGGAAGIAGGIASGNYAQAVTSGLQMITNLNKSHDAKLQKQIDLAEQSQKVLTNIYDNIEFYAGKKMGGLYTASSDSHIQKEIDKLNNKYLKSYAGYGSADNFLDHYDEISEAGIGDRFGKGISNSLKATISNPTMAFMTAGVSFFAGFFQKYSDEAYDFAKQFKDVYDYSKDISDELRDALEAMSESGTVYDAELASLIAQRDEAQNKYNSEKKKKDSDESALIDYEQEIEELNQQIDYFAEDMAESLYGIDFKSWASDFASSLVDAWASGANAAKAYKSAVTDVLKSVATSVIQQKLIETQLTPIMENFMDYFKNNKGVVEEEGMDILSDMFDVAENVSQSSSDFMDTIEQYAQKRGYTLKDQSTGLSSAVAGVTEDTADLLGSYINSIRAYVATQNIFFQQLSEEQIPQISGILMSQLSALNQIQTNTYNIHSVLDDFRSMVYNTTMGINPIGVKLISA